MSFRIPRKSRPQGDVEIYGGPLKQRRFDGGMNIDLPASEIRENELAYAENVICREYGIEPRAGSLMISDLSLGEMTRANFYGYCHKPINRGSTYDTYSNIVNYSGAARIYWDNPIYNHYIELSGYDYLTNLTAAAYNLGTGDTTIVPYRRGAIVFTSSKISYIDGSGAFQVNSAKPVHGISDDKSTGNYKYRYLITLSRISAYASTGLISTYASTDRLATDAEVVHESATNGERYNAAGTSTARQTDYGEVWCNNAITASTPYAITNADLKAVFSTAASVTNDLAAKHFTHVSIYRCTDLGDAGIALGNNSAIFYWVADVKRSDVMAGSGFSDTFSDDSIQNNGIIVKAQGFDPMPSGSCGDVAGGWMFVSDRTNATPDNYLHYCAVDIAPENIGYYFKDLQKQRFDNGVRVMKANGDILSIFCDSSSHICNLTSYTTDTSRLESIPVLNYFHQVDKSIGIKDWATLDSIDENTMIAVCSDYSVRKWDTTKWGDDLSYNKVSSEIKQIVSASPSNYEQGSVGKYYNGAYYLYYSKTTADVATTNCLRYGLATADNQYSAGSNKKAGFGWTFYTGTPMPPFKRGLQVMNGHNGVHRLIVAGSDPGISSGNKINFFWVETFKPFVGAYDYNTGTVQMDRSETDFLAANEISSTWKFRELIGAAETDILVHEQTYNRWRPLSVSVGYRVGMQVSMSSYKDGSSSAYETITNQPKTGALKFTKEVAARRVQLSVSVNVGGWLYVGVESLFRSLDKQNIATAGDNSSTESTTSYPQYQAELASSLNNWITRRETSIDRATALPMTASGSVSLVTGPDGVSESAISFSNSYYTSTVAKSYSDDYTISFFVKEPTINQNVFSIAGTTPFTFKFTSNTQLVISGLGTITVASVATGWHHFVIKMTDNFYRVTQNGTSRAVGGPIATTLGGGNLTLGMAAGSCKVYDFRAFNSVVSIDALSYLYNDVINNSALNTLPQV